MIPYFELRTIPLAGGASLAVFGILVAAGVLAGVLFAESRARALAVPSDDLHAAIAWAVVPGFVSAHLVALMPYLGTSGGWSLGVLFEYWHGMSSFGGFAGALVGLTLYHYLHPRAPRLAMAEILVQALVVGWVFGRLGCTVVHDHIGKPSNFWLAIRFPDGPRHDLGLYELLYTVFVLVPAVVILNRKARPPGTTIAWISLLYAPARFLGDFLRNTDLPTADARYLGLTLGQYGSIVLACVGLALAYRIRKRGNFGSG